MTEIVTQLTIDARGAQQGTAEFDRALRVAQGAVDRFLDRNRAAQAAMDKTTMVMTSGSSTISKLARDYEKLQAALDPTSAAIARARRELEQTKSIADKAFTNLGRPLQEVNAIVDQATVKYGRLATAARTAAEAQAQAARAAAQSQINARLGVQASTPGAAAASAQVFQADLQRQANAVQKLRVEYDQLSIAQERRAESEAQINKFAAAGLIGEQQRLTMIDAVTRRYEDTAAALARTQVPLGKYVTGVGLARNELINLSRQAQDVFVSLASGQSPLTVLIQQGTQIADVFAASRGSIGGFFAQLGAGLLANAPLLGTLAVALAAAGAAYAAFSVAGQKQDLANSLLGVGRAAGITGDQLNALAKESAAAGNVSVSTARSITAEYTKTGKIAPSIIRDLIRVSKDYAVTTGQEVPDAAKDLAASFADPIRGMETLNSRLGTLGPSVQRAVRDAVNQNDAYRAQKILVDALVSSTERAANATSFWARTWDSLKRSVSDGVDAVGEAIGNRVDPSKQQQLNTVLSQRASIQERIKRLTDAGATTSGTIGRLQANDSALANEEARIRRQIELQQQAAKAAQERVQTTNALNAAEARSKDYNADKERIDDLTKSVTDLRRGYEASTKALDEMVKAGPEAIQSDKFTQEAQRAAEYERNLQTATRQLEEFRSAQVAGSIEADKAAKALDIQAQFTGKLTAVQQGELAAQLKLNELRGSSLSDAQRQAEADRARTAARLEGVRAEAEAAAAAKYGTDSLNAQTKAIRENGSEAGKAAEIRARAAKEAAETGGSAVIREQQLLAEELARVQNERIQNNAKLKEAADLERKLNAEVAAGRITLAQANQQLQVNQATEENNRKLRALGVNDNKVLAASNREVAEAVRARLTVEQQRAALGILENQNQTIQALEREIALIGQSTAARRIELEILQAKQQLVQQGIRADSAEGQQIIEKARRIGELNVQLDQTRKAYDGIKQAQDFVADGFKNFVEELITGTDGINGALKSLGKGYLSASLDALISGKGPLASITGMASNDNKSQGGIFGWLAGLPKEVGKAVQQGSEKGSAVGVVTGIDVASTNGGAAGLFGIDSKQLAGGLSAIAGLAGAYGTGAAAGSFGQAVGGGAISGAMAGASLATGLGMAGNMALPGIGLVIGAGLAYYGQQQARKQAREQREREAQENYKNAQPAIATMRSQLRGDPQNTLKIQIAEAEAATRKLTDVMFFAKKYDEERETYLDFKKYEARLLSEYRDGFIGMIQSMEAGLGPNSPFAQAKSAVADFGKELQGFIENAETAFGQGTPQVDQARQASIAYAVSVLDGAKSLTLVQQRMQEIQGTGAGLVKVLVDLGVASEQAGEAVTAGVAMAVQRLRDTFETDLQAKTNEALDKGYLNDARSLLLEIQQLATDSRTLGTDPGNITRYFQAAAQNLVDEANLTGDAFEEFLRLFPEFTGNVVAAGQALEDASRRLGYIDRLFNATNDTSTLAGQLAAYDRQAMREREEEIRLGGQYILELEAAQQAERFNIIRDFNKAANDNYKQSLQQAQDYVARFTRSIQEYLDGLRAGSDSPLSPQARLAAAQSQYNAQLALAQGGDRAALDSITSYASDLLDAAKGFFASSTGFQEIFAQIQSQLGALPSQISAEQFIVNAIEAGADQTVAAVDAMKVTLQSAVSSGSASEIAAALSTYFNRIDSNTSASIDFNEMQAALGGMASNSQLRDMFTRLDKDNSGSLDKLELINSATGQVRGAVNAQDTMLNAIQAATAASNNNIAAGNALSGDIRNLSIQMKDFGSNTAQNTLNTAASLTVLADMRYYAYAMHAMMQQQNRAWGLTATGTTSLPVFADGGYTGPGGKYDPAGIVHKGEIVWSQSDISRFGGVAAVEALRTNDNLALPAMPVPVMGGGDMRAVVSELRAVKAELASLRSENSTGHTRTASAAATGAMHVREGVDIVASNTAAAARAERRKAAAA
jgi:hypothetical protein